MKLTILQENLAKGLNTTNRSVATRAQLPILSNVLLATDKGRLKISATNLETGINLWLGANLEKEGQISIPAKIFAEYVSSLPADKIELEVKENKLFLNCGGYQADFVGLPAGEFPTVPSLTGKADFAFKGEILETAANQVAFAAATDESRPVLTGVLLKVINEKLILVATDGYRLSMKTIAIEEGVVGKKKEEVIKIFKKGLIIPARTLAEVSRAVNESEEKEVGLAITPKSSQVIFALPDMEIISRLLEGSFPDYQRFIPEKETTKIIVEREAMVRAVRAAAIFARESANIIKFSITPSEFMISANTAQVGQNKIKIEAKVEGKKDKIAFNSRYLLDFLASTDAEEISFGMSGSLNPGIFQPVKDTSFLHIIGAVRIQE